MKVLLVGSGGREHALAWKLSQSSLLKNLYIAPGNPGTAQVGENVSIDDKDTKAIVDFAKSEHIDLVVVGPEEPLAAGMVDALGSAGIKAFGPSGPAASMEADKAFAKKIMHEISFLTACSFFRSRHLLIGCRFLADLVGPSYATSRSRDVSPIYTLSLTRRCFFYDRRLAGRFST